MEGNKRMFSPDNLSFGLVLGLSFLLPIFFLPINGINIDVGKVFFVAIVALLALALQFAGRLVDGRVRLPKSMVLVGVIAVVLSFLISALFSPTLYLSLFGQGIETATFAFILLASLLAVTISLSVDSRNKIFYIYTAILASFAVTALYQVIRLFAGPAFLSFGVFTDNLSNMVGKWNDLATFVGLVGLISLSTIELFSLSKLYKALLYVVLAASVFLLAVINFTFAWLVMAVVSVVVFVYTIYLNRFDQGGSQTGGKNRIPFTSLVVFLISLFFYFTANTTGGFLANYFKTSQVEVRPSWSATYDIAKETLKAHPIFGAGPNRFTSEWSLHKPDVLNNTVFWATDFNFGVGLIPTIIVTTGGLGLLAWLFFLCSMLYSGARAVLRFSSGRVSQYLVLSSFVTTIYLWLFSIFYVPNVTILSMAFLFTGLFVAVLSMEGITKTIDFSLLGNPKIGFVSVLILIFLIVFCASFGYMYTQKAYAIVQFQKAVTAVNVNGSVDNGEMYLQKAVDLNPNDVYYRGLSQIAMIRLNNLFQQKDLAPDKARTEFSSLMGKATDNAKQAISYDTTNYTNWMNLGSIYEAIVPLNVNGAYEEASKDYQAALNDAPKNPLIYYSLARLEVTHKDTKKAREYLNKSLEVKSDYTDALFFLSQIEASEGNTQEAIAKAEQASMLAPNSVGLFFQLGLLKYTAKDYEGAVTALERATSLTPDYANAMYFLGLSYSKVGRTDDAVKVFQRISELNPDNQEVKNILTNLKSDKDPFANVAPPNNAPEKKKSPPIKETKKASDEL